jgi:galactonate dehydratase
MSELKITDIDISILEGPRPWFILRIKTDQGITGVGEIPPTHHHPAEIERVGQRLQGKDPFETEHLFGADGVLGTANNDIFTTTITGGFDIACWDIKGKYLDMPVHQLLGGKLRNDIRAYANGWDFDARRIVKRYKDGDDRDEVLADTKAEITDAASDVVDAGYTALKFSPFQWGDGPTTSSAELDCALTVVEAVSETVPPQVELLVEGHKHLSTDKALQAARRLEQFNPGFYEEPVPAEITPLQKVSRRSPVPIATGESFTTHRGFNDLLTNAEIDVVQPDIVRAGGITELQKIAALASAQRVGFAPHNAGGPIMTFAAIHVDATTPSFMLQETFEEFFHPDWGTDLMREPLTISDGAIEVPTRPGLGVELNESVLREHDITDQYRE